MVGQGQGLVDSVDAHLDGIGMAVHHQGFAIQIDLALGIISGMALEAVALQQDPYLRAVVHRELGKSRVVPGPGKGDRRDDRGQN